MNTQANDRRPFASASHGREPEDQRKAAREPGPKPETTQAERAAMHPERHDLEWGYYFTAWSH